jgi:hypothetical protein
MILPEWLKNQENALLIIAIFLLLWLWLLINRRQEEQQLLPERSTPLSVEELGRKAFICGRNTDIYLYRGLFINGSEANELLGNIATEYLEKRSPKILSKALDMLCNEIPNSATYVGLGKKKGTKLVIKIKIGTEEKDITIGSVTNIGNVWRLLEPCGGLDQ